MKRIDNIKRKRALYTGLHPFLQENEIMEALILWETQYATKPQFSVRYFVVDLVRSLERNVQTRELLVHLVSILS